MVKTTISLQRTKGHFPMMSQEETVSGAQSALERSTLQVVTGRWIDQEAHASKLIRVKQAEDATEEPQPGFKDTVDVSTPGILQPKSTGGAGIRASGAGDEFRRRQMKNASNTNA